MSSILRSALAVLGLSFFSTALFAPNQAMATSASAEQEALCSAYMVKVNKENALMFADPSSMGKVVGNAPTNMYIRGQCIQGNDNTTWYEMSMHSLDKADGGSVHSYRVYDTSGTGPYMRLKDLVVGKASPDDMANNNTADNDIPNLNVPNYGLYGSLITDYKTAYGEMDFTKVKRSDSQEVLEASGVLLTRFIDFNNDGIKELVIGRVDKKRMDFKDSIQIYGFVKGKLTHLGKFSPQMTPGDYDHYSFNFVEKDGITYVATNTYQDHFSAIFWKLNDNGFFQVATRFDASARDHQEFFYIDENQTDAEIFHQKLGELGNATKTIALSFADEQDFMSAAEANMMAVGQANLEGLYDLSNGTTPTASFNGSQFVIFEKKSFNEQEKVIKEYFNAKIHNDVKGMSQYVATWKEEFKRPDYMTDFNVEVEKRMIDGKHYIPAYVIEDIRIIRDSFAGISLNLADEVAKLPAMSGIDEVVFVQCTINEVRDTSHTTFAPQMGYGTYNHWFALAKGEKYPNWTIYWKYSNHFQEMQGPRNAFYVSHILEQSAERTNKFIDYYVAPDKRDTLKTFSDKADEEGGSNYLIKPTWVQASLEVYEALDHKGSLGKLLFKTNPGETLLLKYNPLNNKKIVIRTMSPVSNVFYTYYPDHDQSNNALYGDYAEAMKKVNP